MASHHRREEHIYKEGSNHVMYIQRNNIQSFEKEQNFAISSNMDGLGGYYAKEISQTEKNKYCITYMWNLKDTTDQYNKKEADSQVQKPN